MRILPTSIYVLSVKEADGMRTRRLRCLRDLCGIPIILALCVLHMSGCIHRNNGISGPSTPKALQVTDKREQYVLNEIANFYYGNCLQLGNPLPSLSTTISAPQSSAAPDCGTPRQKRDAIIYDLKLIIDHNYEDYARHFQQTADITTFIGEVGSASLSAVGTLVGASSLKDILSTASTLTQSTNVSIQKDFFQKQTDYAILGEMDADRLKKWSEIADLMKNNDLNTYSLNAALNDLLEYKRVGTATAALTSIEQHAGAQTVTASAQLSETAKQGLSSKPEVPSTTPTSLSLTQAPGAQGFTFIAAVTTTGGAVPTGSVTFADGASAIGTVSLDATGRATFTVNTLSRGSHTISASYTGAGTYQPSTASLTVSAP